MQKATKLRWMDVLDEDRANMEIQDSELSLGIVREADTRTVL